MTVGYKQELHLVVYLLTISSSRASSGKQKYARGGDLWTLRMGLRRRVEEGWGRVLPL